MLSKKYTLLHTLMMTVCAVPLFGTLSVLLGGWIYYAYEMKSVVLLVFFPIVVLATAPFGLVIGYIVGAIPGLIFGGFLWTLRHWITKKHNLILSWTVFVVLTFRWYLDNAPRFGLTYEQDHKLSYMFLVVLPSIVAGAVYILIEDKIQEHSL